MIVADRTEAPAFKLIENIKVPEVEKLVLNNGVPVYYLNSGSQDVVKIELNFDAGIWQQTQPLVATLTNAMLLEGTSNMLSSEISEKVDYYGAFLHPQVDKDGASITLYTLNKYLSETITVLSDVIQFSTFPENEFTTLLNKRRQQFTVDSEKVKVLAGRKFQEVLFGADSPYGLTAKLEDFDKLKTSQLHEFFYHKYSSVNCRIVVAGKITKTTKSIIKASFSDKFGNQNGSSSRQVIGTSSSGNKIHAVQKPGAVQSAIRIGKPMINKQHPDFSGLKFLNTLFGGYFGSRLMANIREDKGYTYGISSLLISLKHSGYLAVVSEVGSEVAQNTIDEVKYEMSALHEHLVPEEELFRVRNYLLGELLRDIDGPFSASETYKSLLDFDLDFNFIVQMADSFRNITDRTLQDLAQKYLDPESMYYVTAGPGTESR
jgi:zinc protease